MKTGNTTSAAAQNSAIALPQWSPVMKTGNTSSALNALQAAWKPQWSPVMKTGNTRRRLSRTGRPLGASMEPGHEDREYSPTPTRRSCRWTCLNGARS